MKQPTRQRKPVKGFFDAWAQSLKLVVRIGGNYTVGPKIPICVGNEPCISLTKDGETGWAQISFALRNRTGEVVAQMDNNDFVVVPWDIHDLHTTVTKHQLKIWIDSEDVGVDLSFRWLTLDAFLKLFEKDQKRSRRQSKPRHEDHFSRLPPALAQEQRKLDSGPPPPLPDQIITSLKECLVEGRLPLIDIKEMSIYRNGVKTIVKNGIYSGKGFYDACLVVSNSERGFNLPAYEEQAMRRDSLYALSNGMAHDDQPESSFEDKTFSRRVMVVDGKTFRKCRFEQCSLVYKGGVIPIFDGCDLQSCRWVFDEAAARTIQMLHLIYHGFGKYSEQIVNQIFEDVKAAVPTKPQEESKPSGTGSSG